MSVSGQNVPGAVKGWHQIMVEDFDIDVPRGKFVGHPAYAARWDAYPSGWPSTQGRGTYNNSILEVTGSCLVENIHTDAHTGQHWTAALRPKLSATPPWGVKSLRRVIRFKADKMPGYKVAWLLWPDSGHWPTDGEIDFPECSLDGDTAKGFMHQQDGTAGSDQVRGASTVNITDGQWHTATINWKSGTWRTPVCEFILDGDHIGKWTERVPDGPMHEVIQTEAVFGHNVPSPDPKVAGQIHIDWYTAYVAA